MDATNVIFVATLGIGFAGMMSEAALVEAPGRAWATIFAVAASVISASEILGHLRSYSSPTRQRYVIRVLLMVPIYAVDSLWGFFDKKHSSALGLARDTYESYVIYNFFHLLLDLNGGAEATCAYWKAKKPTLPHMFPLRGEMQLNARAIGLWRFFMTQYMVLSPLLTLLTYGLTYVDEYDENSWSLENGHIYIAIARCVSVTFAFTALLYFYLATKYNIHDRNPTGKFLSIKAIVFLGCWQGIVISILEVVGVFPMAGVRHMLFKPEDPTTNEAAVGALENMMVCLEVLGAAIAHHFVFSYREFDAEAKAVAGGSSPKKARAKTSFAGSVLHAFSVADVAQEAAASADVVKKNK